MKNIFPLFLLLITGYFTGNAIANTFDPATNVLTLDAVTVTGDRKYSNVVIRIDQFTVLGVGSSAPVNNSVSGTCGSKNFTVDKFNAIQVGMSIDQVNQVIGCKFKPRKITRTIGLESREWGSTATGQIIVWFDQSTLKVSNSLGDGFKLSFFF